jgi:ElaB/YqjD/DUF883 family membrane-anchored ribosome-binding protein
MDNQKPYEGSARNVGSEGAGSSMGKDLGSSKSGAGSTGGTSGPGGMSGMGQDLSKTTSTLHQTIDKAADAAQPVVDRLASGAHEGVDKMSGALTDASARLDEKSKQLTEAYQHFAETGRGYVRTSPATSVMVAMAAGFVLAKLLSGRSSRF